eukprot:7587063-Pyramimonas_sp.AAC.1
MREARPRPPEVADSIAAAENLLGWAVHVRRLVFGRRSPVIYGAFQRAGGLAERSPGASREDRHQRD